MEADKLFKPHVGKWLRVSFPVADVYERKMHIRVTMHAKEFRTLWLEFEKDRWLDHLETIREGDCLHAEGRIKEGDRFDIHLVDCEVLGREDG